MRAGAKWADALDLVPLSLAVLFVVFLVGGMPEEATAAAVVLWVLGLAGGGK